MMLQLNPTIEVQTPKGKGYAHFLLNYSMDENLAWVVFMEETKEFCTFRNLEVRGPQPEVTPMEMGRILNLKLIKNEKGDLKIH